MTNAPNIRANLTRLIFILAIFSLQFAPQVASQQKVIQTVTIGNIRFVVIPKGCFLMGSDISQHSSSSDEMVADHKHKVCIDSFFLAESEITQKQYLDIVGPKKFGLKDDSRPATKVSWDDTLNFINAFNKKYQSKIRLPSEAEWEYAARAGSDTLYSWGEQVGINNAVCLGCGSKWDNNETAPVKSFSPNNWGLYDMHGNVWEWVNDWYKADYYAESPQANPQGPIIGYTKVLRGGSSFTYSRLMRSSKRISNLPHLAYDDNGFRVAFDLDAVAQLGLCGRSW